MPGPGLPFKVFLDFFDPAFISQLLDYTVTNEARFEPGKVGAGSGGMDSSMRVSRALGDLGPLTQELAGKVLKLASTLIVELGISTFEPSGVELELVSHGNGAFYRQHIDTGVGPQRKDRMISAVYYFNAEPKAFTGGSLRLYDLGPPDSLGFADIEPIHNTFVAFPSWIPHEVLPVVCPSQRFIDSRFSINCWLWRRKAATEDAQNSSPR